MKHFLLKIFNLKELWQEIQKREFLLPPDVKRNLDEEKIYFRIKQQFPQFIDLLKIKEYNLTREIFTDQNFLSGRRFELRTLIGKLEGASEVLSKEEQKKRVEVFKKIDEGIFEIQKQISGSS